MSGILQKHGQVSPVSAKTIPTPPMTALIVTNRRVLAEAVSLALNHGRFRAQVAETLKAAIAAAKEGVR